MLIDTVECDIPMRMSLEKQNFLEDSGYLLIGQVGYSMFYYKGETKEEREEVANKNKEYMEYVRRML